jgi:hypothetical protein
MQSMEKLDNVTDEMKKKQAKRKGKQWQPKVEFIKDLILFLSIFHLIRKRKSDRNISFSWLAMSAACYHG